MKEKIELGDRAKDTISGFTGIVVAITHWLNGCVRITLGAETLKDGCPVANYTCDEQQVVVIQKGARPAAETTAAVAPAKPGGPSISPTRAADPAGHE